MKTTFVLVVIALLISMMLAVLAGIRAPMDVHQFQIAFPVQHLDPLSPVITPGA